MTYAIKDFTAIIAPSESLAIGALYGLKKRDVKIPEDLGFACFDNSNIMSSANPSLTTAYTSFFEISRIAMENIIDLIEGKKLPDIALSPTKLVVRQSCGCHDSDFMQEQGYFGELSNRPDGATLNDMLINRTPSLHIELSQIWGDTVVPDWNYSLCNSFIEAVIHRSTDSINSYFRQLENVNQYFLFTEEDCRILKLYIKNIRNFINLYFPHPGIIENNTFLFKRTNNLILTASRRLLLSKIVLEKYILNIETIKIREISNLLVTTFSTSELLDLIYESFPGVGITECYIAYYDKQTTSPDKAIVQLAFNSNGRLSVSDIPSFSKNLLLPDSIFPSQSTFNLLVQALYFRETQIGYVIIGVSKINSNVFELIRSMISSALQRIMLIQNIEEQTKNLKIAKEVAEAATQAKGEFLANMSHEKSTWTINV